MFGGLDSLALALSHLADPVTVALLVAGIVIGLVIGILPDLGPPIAIALALPFTFYLDTVPSLVLLLGIYSAAIYGGSISAIAVGIPGTGAAIATVEDGHRMFKAGRGGEALGFSLTGSIVGGLVAVVCLAFIAPLLAEFAIRFGPREYLAISVFGLAVVVRVAGDNMFKGLLVGALGIFLTTWGLDELNGAERYTFGTYNLYEGIPIVPFLVGLLAMSEVMIRAERALNRIEFTRASLTVRLPGLKTLARMKDLLLLADRRAARGRRARLRRAQARLPHRAALHRLRPRPDPREQLSPVPDHRRRQRGGVLREPDRADDLQGPGAHHLLGAGDRPAAGETHMTEWSKRRRT